MKYLAVSAYVDGAPQTILFELKSTVAPTPDPKDLYSTLSLDSRSDAVADLQKRLVELGYLEGNADGIYGEKTVNAVKAAQKAYDMEQSGTATPEFQVRLFSNDQPEPTPSPEPTESSPD
ncbi:MAG: peptidoglycan-binding protein [Clostridia bacterium]|nr:peptidoglycan-binding protein [Clostridia bacterium]